MKNFLTAVLSALLILSFSPSSAQKTKKPATWQDSVIGTWAIDSFVVLSSFPGLDKMPKREPSYMRLFPGGTMMTYEDKEGAEVALGRFDLVQGNHRYILMGSISFMRIEKMADGRMQLLSQHDFIHSRLYLSRSDFEFPEAAGSIAGDYTLRESTAFGVMQEVMMYMEGFEPPENATKLHLDSTGKMTGFFGEADSGTWKLTADFILELNGKVQRRYSIREMGRKKLVLHPLDMPEDSLLFFWKTEKEYPVELGEWPEEEPPAYPDNYDSILLADSTMAIVEQMEYDMMTDEPSYPQTWQTLPSGDIQLVFRADHTLLFKEGKKKHKGNWTIPIEDTWEEQTIPVSMDGRQQILVCQVSTDYGYETPQKQLTLTLVPPGSKKLVTYVLYLVNDPK